MNIITVNTTDDSLIPLDSKTSLREAIAEANLQTGDHRIVFDLKDDDNLIRLTLGELLITDASRD